MPKYHLLVPSVAPRVLDPDEYDDSHDQDSDKAIIGLALEKHALTVIHAHFRKIQLDQETVAKAH